MGHLLSDPKLLRNHF